MKTAKKIKAKLTAPSTKPQEAMKMKPKCEEHFPTRDKLARMEKPPGRVETDLIATSESTNLSNFQAKKNFFEHYMKKGDILRCYGAISNYDIITNILCLGLQRSQ
jgi:hypothetical protein